jgi:hypothetical protein
MLTDEIRFSRYAILYKWGQFVLLEGPVNDGYILGKRKLNFSITGPSSVLYIL